jgi:1-acyl-sn-glycerol-3-phosphate acyltransferase
MLYAILKPIARALAWLLCRIEGRGVDRVPARGPVLLVANHSSVLDPPLVGCVARRRLSFLAKAELFGIPLFGRLIHALNARPVRREGSDPGALRTALRTLQEERALLVFPEGTRGEDGTLRPAKPGAGMLAVLSGAAVVPVYIQGSGRVWPRGRALPRPGKVIVTFGPPLHFESRDSGDRKAQYEAASAAMMDAIRALRDGPPLDGGSGGRENTAIAQHAASGAGGAAQGPPKYIDGRKGQHGQG